MVNIVHCRVDDRLIHGQVATAWLPHTNANLCLVVNDSIAVNDDKKLLLQMALPEGIQLRCFSVKKIIEIINKAADHQRMSFSVKTYKMLLNSLKVVSPLNP
ncbi:PTS system sorbose subfamily IIB component [Enterobacter soli]|uniref:PTS sugar transporter subunit IIB n=1 Tax=Enterobacter soli TaxID=885040 RepID=UPI000223CF96|nr:PTS sugar transporter subunit IIB [Enterobacter soli]AEN65589.1 PTS system sorbose subfamily IIB component [Enterobacter soli]OAT35985.1 PTS system sorbose-specific IIB component [Enterobacter soli ATCC BAA-2102]